MRRRAARGRLLGAAALTLALAAQSVALASPATVDADLPAAGAGSSASAAQTLAEEQLRIERLSGPNRIETAVAVSGATFTSADTALLARADDFADALVAAPLAARLKAPLLLTGRDRLAPATAAELERLGVDEVVLLGGVEAIGPGVASALAADGYSVRRLAGRSRFDTAAAVADALGPEAGTVYVATGADFPDALSVGPLAAAQEAPILLTTRDQLPAPTVAALADLEPERIVLLGGTGAISEAVENALRRRAPTSRLAGPTRFATAGAVFDAAVRAGLDPDDLWLADGKDFPDALVAGPVIGASGGTLLLVDGRQVDAPGLAYDRIRARGARLQRVTLLGGSAAISADAPRQVEGVALGAELPRGGRLLFPYHRMVGLYGNARSPAMGILGEQPPEAAAQRAERVAAPFAVGGRKLLPTFELIVTVATRAPGPDGMYRSVSRPDEVQRYLDVARRHGLYLLLDIQPGRSDFLTEVRRYEQFLDEPDVGIALDPEWRMGPNGVPGQEVGSVDAAEVNRVVDYLAGIVRAHRLPQKLLVVHQFQQRMIRNRNAIKAPPELAVTFHVDGFGGRSIKLEKYESFLAPRPYAMGFKLFYDEDTNLYAPAEVLAFRVPPDLVTYQ